MNSPCFLVVMAGGSGTRFWPKSTAKRPKQLLTFGKGPDAKSLLSMTSGRFDGWVPKENRIIVTTELLRDAVEKESSGAKVLAEPQGRNTAPCVYWSAREVAAKDPQAIMMVMPADHYIAHPSRFRETVRAAAEWAATHDDLVALGVNPTRPETGYGYLQVGQSKGGGCSAVAAFVEKPDASRAIEFLRSGKYLWNGGMFLWRAEVVLRAFDESMPQMREAWEASGGKIERAYPLMPATSVDYGIMEKAKNVVTFALDCGWDDLGSWTSLEELGDALGIKNEAGVVSGGEVISVDSKENIVDAPSKTVALLGVEDLIVVQQGDVLLVADKNRAQDIRLVVEKVKREKPSLA